MSLKNRLDRLERDAPRLPESLEVTVHHEVVEPGPDGKPVPVGPPIVGRWVDGRRV